MAHMPSNKVLAGNIVRRMRDLTAYLNLAYQEGLSTTAKSTYFRAAIMTQTTIIEGLIFYIIRREAKEINPVIGQTKNDRVIKTIRDQVLNVPEIKIIEEREKPFRLSDRPSTFSTMNQHCLNRGIFSEKEHKMFEEARDKRASLHIHTLKGDDLGYTSSTSKKLNQAIYNLVDKLALYPITEGQWE